MPLTVTVEKKTSEDELTRELGKITGREVYTINCSEACSSGEAETAADATGDLPTIGEYLDGIAEDVPARKRTIRCKSPARDLYEATIEYDDTNEIVEDPLSVPTTYEQDEENFDEPYFEDETSGTPKQARHTNGIPFSTLPTRQKSVSVITITKNVVGSTTMSAYASLRNKTNTSSTSIDGETWGARCLRVAKISLSKVQTLNGTSYRTLTTVLKGKADTWDQSFESLGVQELVSGALKPILDGNDAAVSEPWPLQSDGTKAASQATAGYEIVLKPYVTADISSLT